LPGESGVEGMALETIAARAPLVCTPEAVEGLRLEPDRHFLAARDDAALATAVLRVLDEPVGARARAGKAARVARRHHSADRQTEELQAWLARLAQEAGNTALQESLRVAA